MIKVLGFGCRKFKLKFHTLNKVEKVNAQMANCILKTIDIGGKIKSPFLT